MITQFYGYKSGQEQTFNDEGNRLVVTRIKTFPLKKEKVENAREQMFCFIHIILITSIILQLYPHSLSYQPITLTRLPFTLVKDASKMQE